MQRPELWEKIDHYEFPESFKMKLMEAGIGWGQRRACDEYLRFVYLMMVSQKPLRPSGVVDTVWHVHLSYTREYWKTFCAEILDKELHHDPDEGLESYALNDEQYLETLRLYEREFGAPPPLRVWPTKKLWRRVIRGGLVALLGSVLGVIVILSGQANGLTWLGAVALSLILGGGGYAMFNLPSGRPSASGAACSGSGCGG